MLIQPLLATVFLLGIVTSTTLQKKPDFSGDWILNRPASTLSPGSDAVQSGVVRIEHREPVFRYKAALVSGANPFEYAYELMSDGREVKGTQQGRPTVSSLRWDGDVLVFTGRIQRPDAEVEVFFDTSYSMAGADFEPWNRFEEAGETKTTFGYSSAADKAGAVKP